MSKQLDPSYAPIRTFLRFVGPLVVLLGLIFALIGLVNFFSAFGSHEPPRLFWCLFVGMLLISLGSAICKFAFIGLVTRYLANEVTPVGKDATNYLIHGTKDSVRDLAAAVSEGLSAGASARSAGPVCCERCSTDNDPTAKFCKACGSSLLRQRQCASCGEQNDSDARFCNHCGTAIASL